MKSFTVKGRNYIIVDVPQDKSNTFGIILNGLIIHNDDGFGHRYRDLPNDSNYKIIGLTKDLTEDQCAEIVEGNNGDETSTMWRNYLIPKSYFAPFMFHTPKVSFLSLLQSLNIGEGLLIEKQ